MVLAQVRERERVEAHAVEPAVVRAVRRRLERHRLVAGIDHLAEETLQVDGLRRRVGRLAHVSADDPLDGPHQPRPPPVRLEDRAQQMGRRGLAVRAGDAGDGEPLGRRAEEGVGRDGHRGARGLDDELRHGDVHRVLDDERGRPGRDGLGGEIVTVHARSGHAEEQRAVADAARVVGEVGDLDGPSPDHVARRERADQRVELHQRDCSGAYCAAARGGLQLGRVRRHLEVLEREAGDVAEDRRRDDAAPDLAVRLVDHHENRKTRLACRHEPDERRDVLRARTGRSRPCSPCPSSRRPCSPGSRPRCRCPRPPRRGTSPSSGRRCTSRRPGGRPRDAPCGRRSSRSRAASASRRRCRSRRRRSPSGAASRRSPGRSARCRSSSPTTGRTAAPCPGSRPAVGAASSCRTRSGRSSERAPRRRAGPSRS